MRMTIVLWGILAVQVTAIAAPATGTTMSSSEHLVPTGTVPQSATYGLCSGPQNAEDFPSSPVQVVETTCDYTQEFHSTSPTASYGSTCGGFTVAFGPKGDPTSGSRLSGVTRP